MNFPFHIFLLHMFHLFTFNVIFIVGFISAISLFVFCMSVSFLKKKNYFLLMLSFEVSEYFLAQHFNDFLTTCFELLFSGWSKTYICILGDSLSNLYSFNSSEMLKCFLYLALFPPPFCAIIVILITYMSTQQSTVIIISVCNFISFKMPERRNNFI